MSASSDRSVRTTAARSSRRARTLKLTTRRATIRAASDPGEIGGTGDAGAVAQGGDPYLGLRAVAAAGDVPRQRRRSGLDQQLAGRRDATADDEDLRVEQRRERRQRLPQPPPEIGQQLH